MNAARDKVIEPTLGMTYDEYDQSALRHPNQAGKTE
jgi:hypothetical protein